MANVSLSAFPLIGGGHSSPGSGVNCGNVKIVCTIPRRDHHPNGTKFSGDGTRPGEGLVGALFPNLRPLGKMSPEMLPLITIYPTFLPGPNHFNQQTNKSTNKQRCSSSIVLVNQSFHHMLDILLSSSSSEDFPHNVCVGLDLVG